MALHAVRFPAVRSMTGRAMQGCMFALVLPELFDLLGMAGQARIGKVAGKGYLLGSVRVLVARQTILELEVGLALMAVAAERDRSFHLRRMPLMASLAGNVLVFPPFGSQVGRRGVVTFRTVIIRQDRGGKGIRGGCSDHPQYHNKNRKADNNNLLLLHIPSLNENELFDRLKPYK